jgi:16S rRNA (cytosine1407-C5)-methyltransferase
LTYDEAIAYLRREAISIPDSPKGFILLTYRDLPLGFVKNIGNRANNLYPNEWRIRT